MHSTSGCVLYDRLVNPELLNYAKKNADLINCGKQPGCHRLDQNTIQQRLVNEAKKGKVVTRLKGGDPFVYGRGGEEASALVKHEVEFEVVPGITSGIAAPAYAGIPITHREYSSTFAFVAGHRRKGQADNLCWESLATGIDTLAIYMGVRNLTYIQQQLLKHGRSKATPVAIIQSGTTKKQTIVTSTLASIVEIAKTHPIQNPSMIIVGEVVRLREKLEWFQPLRTPKVDFAALSVNDEKVSTVL